MTAPYRSRLLTVTKYVIALALLGWIATRIDLEVALASLGALGPATLGVVALVTVLEFGSRFSMWYVLLNARKSTTLRQSIRVDLVIKHVNLVLPSKASGHSIAPLIVHHYTDHDWPESLALAAVNTGLYASLYGFVAVVALLFTAPFLGPGLLALLTVTTLVYLGVGCLTLVGGRRIDVLGGPLGTMVAFATKIPWIGPHLGNHISGLGSVAESTAPVLRSVSTRPATIAAYSLGWVGTLFAFPALRVWVLLEALGAQFMDPMLLPLVLVLAYSVTVLPVTPGGIGITEASATLVLVAFGVPEAVAVVAILIDRALGVYLPALLGWIPLTRIDVASLLDSRTEP